MENLESVPISTIPNLSADNIREHTADEIFKDLYDIDMIQSIMQERFTDAYLIVINPHKIQEYPNPYIQEIAKKYKSFAEHRPLNILLLKKNLTLSPKALQRFEELKAVYGDMIEIDKKQYSMIIGFFGGTTGRTNQYLIDHLIKSYPIKQVE